MASKWVELQSAEDVLALGDSVRMFYNDEAFAPYKQFTVSQNWVASDWFSVDKAHGWTYRVLVEEDESPTGEEDTDEE